MTYTEARAALEVHTKPDSHARDLGMLFLEWASTGQGMDTPMIVGAFFGRCTSILEIMRGELRDIWGSALTTEKIEGKKYCRYRLVLDHEDRTT